MRNEKLQPYNEAYHSLAWSTVKKQLKLTRRYFIAVISSQPDVMSYSSRNLTRIHFSPQNTTMGSITYKISGHQHTSQWSVEIAITVPSKSVH